MCFALKITIDQVDVRAGISNLIASAHYKKCRNEIKDITIRKKNIQQFVFIIILLYLYPFISRGVLTSVCHVVHFV